MTKPFLFILALASFAFSALADPNCGGVLPSGESSFRELFQPIEISSDQYELVMGIRYTPGAATRVGGAGALRQQVEEAIAGANTIFSNSGIRASIRLGFLTAMTVDEDENGNFPLDACPDCETLNRQARTDISVLLKENGIAFSNIPISISQALQGGRQIYGVLNFKKNTVAHEVGHALGLYHGSREPIDTTQRGERPNVMLPDYGLGVVGIDPNGDEFSTIMSYGNLSNTATPSRLFSNPDLLFNGVPTGTEEANSVRAANFWAQYVSVAGERRYPLPIRLFVLRDGQQTTLSGDCLDGVGGEPAEGVSIRLVHRAEDGTETALDSATCDQFGNFLLNLDSDLSGSFQATHTVLNQSTEFISPLWKQLSLFGSVIDSNAHFSGVCYMQDGLTPRAGETVEIIEFSQEGFREVGRATCGADGRYEVIVADLVKGTFEAQIPGAAFSGQIELSASQADEGEEDEEQKDSGEKKGDKKGKKDKDEAKSDNPKRDDAKKDREKKAKKGRKKDKAAKRGKDRKERKKRCRKSKKKSKKKGQRGRRKARKSPNC